ncbi:hypothetical protein DFP72DRAFT_1174989 [Ephemerocybe angulata]|uniref:Microbial-type PARG catalytic domain-containing protein n=1 Tax=Ephemerocybe angulata TaxID=980116 RepID=A0A8H6HJJ3_9AGAR|nr:hypothetical protein DFP72DRAFT_1174989 [Tulosesus angulatus]
MSDSDQTSGNVVQPEQHQVPAIPEPALPSPSQDQGPTIPEPAAHSPSDSQEQVPAAPEPALPPATPEPVLPSPSQDQVPATPEPAAPNPPEITADAAPTPRRYGRREIAETTLEAIDDGSFELEGQTIYFQPALDALLDGTTFYPPECELAGWANVTNNLNKEGCSDGGQSQVAIVQRSTLEGCHLMHQELAGLEGDVDRRIGVLNFASAKKPGGGFLSGAQAQEETIARSSTLYASLMIDAGREFYTLHHRIVKDGYYTHSMIYSPGVQIFRHDSGEWHAPIDVDVLTSPAVNAGDVRRKNRGGRTTMRGVKNLILGSFGTGVFQNSVELVARLWMELLVDEGSRFKHSFDRVLFAIIDTPTVTKFRRVFSGEVDQAEAETEKKIEGDAAMQVGEVNLDEIKATNDSKL